MTRPPRSELPASARIVIAYVTMAIVIVVDWLTPAGIVVGLLLTVPIVLLSEQDSWRQVVVGTGVALAGFAVAAIYGAGPISPRAVWLPNRIIAAVGIVASGGVSLVLQRHRIVAATSLRAATLSRDKNHLLMRLMAHDLRAPLVAANHALEYVERSISEERPVDLALIAETRLRLNRNLRTAEAVLQLARDDIRSGRVAPSDGAAGSVAADIEREVASFNAEAEARGHQLEFHGDELDGRALAFDRLILRQALAILVDNAIQRADPGPIEVEARVAGDELVARVMDSGPGLSASRRRGERGGSHVGLELCRALVARAGGTLQLERDGEEGTVFCLRLPLATADMA